MSSDLILASPTMTASGLVGGATSVGAYYGYNCTVTTATAAINIRRGSVSGQIIDVVPVGTTAGTTKSTPHGLQCEGGIYVDFNGGTGSLVIRYE